MALQIFANMSNPQIPTAILFFALSLCFHYPPRFLIPKPPPPPPPKIEGIVLQESPIAVERRT